MRPGAGWTDWWAVGTVWDMVSGAMGSRKFKPVASVLPPDQWFQAHGYFQFGMPWPWEQSSDTDPVVDLSDSDGGTSFGLAFAPRYNGSASFALWREPGGLSESAQLPQQMSGLYGGGVAQLRKVALGGSRAVVVTMVVGSEQVDRLLIDRVGYLYSGEFRVPAHVGPAYRPHLDTMLATWQWA